MMEITLSAEDMAALAIALLSNDAAEQCAVLYASQTRRADGRVRLLVREIDVPRQDEYAAQSDYEAVLIPHYVARVTKRARRERQSLIFAHSHPGSSPPEFSRADYEGEEHLARFLEWRNPDNVHAALVMSRGGVEARQLAMREKACVIALGERRTVLSDPNAASGTSSAALFDRQIRAFGEAGQRAIETLRVAIVGLGGTGSIIAQYLAHLGVRRFILVDPDTLEESNLNRVIGSAAPDVGRPKVDVAADAIFRIAPAAELQRVQGNVVRAQIARTLTEADFLFGCTDSHGSRAVMQQVAYQYLIPCIDMGSTITTTEGNLTGVFGRVQLLAPGLGCFTCSGLLDSEEVRRDLMSPFERRLDPYISGERIPAPAVISINGTVSSLALTMFMAVVTGIPSDARYLLYNALKSTLRNVRVTPTNNCYICSRAGALARGDSVPLYARAD
jgi:molybdopterin/thiamine biosynthesis adenylyltransferase